MCLTMAAPHSLRLFSLVETWVGSDVGEAPSSASAAFFGLVIYHQSYTNKPVIIIHLRIIFFQTLSYISYDFYSCQFLIFLLYTYV